MLKKNKLNVNELFKTMKLNIVIPYIRLQTTTDRQYKINLKQLNIKSKQL